MKKKKVLFIVYYFIQAGGERYVYEIAKHLSKEKYEVHFLKIKPNLSNKKWSTEYYYEPTIQAGCQIHFYPDLIAADKNLQKLLRQEKMTRFIPVGRVQAKASTEVAKRKKQILSTFLQKFDIVNWMGIGAYAHLGNSLEKGAYKEYIHILSTKFQYDDDCYAKWDKQKGYTFFTPFSPWLLEKELEGFTNFRHIYFPMSLELIPYSVVPTPRNNKHTIAVFSRIDRMKPMEPYLYALKLLREKKIDAQLYIYGAGDPKATGLKRQIDHLYLSDNVHFKGHAESLAQVMKSGEIDLVWFQSGNNRPAGFAAFEIAMSGIPQVFWDFGHYVAEPEYNQVYPNFTNLSKFVDCSANLLTDKSVATELGEQQKKFVLQNQNIQKNIKIIEQEFDMV